MILNLIDNNAYHHIFLVTEDIKEQAYATFKRIKINSEYESVKQTAQ